MSWNWLRDKDVKSNKEHKCFLCGETINKYEKCISRTGILCY